MASVIFSVGRVVLVFRGELGPSAWLLSQQYVCGRGRIPMESLKCSKDRRGHRSGPCFCFPAESFFTASVSLFHTCSFWLKSPLKLSQIFHISFQECSSNCQSCFLFIQRWKVGWALCTPCSTLLAYLWHDVRFIFILFFSNISSCRDIFLSVVYMFGWTSEF